MCFRIAFFLLNPFKMEKKCFNRIYGVKVIAGQLTGTKTFKTEVGKMVALGATQCKVCDTSAVMTLTESGVSIVDKTPLEFLQRGSAQSCDAYHQLEIATVGTDYEINVSLETALTADHTFYFIVMYDADSSSQLQAKFNSKAGTSC